MENNKPLLTVKGLRVQIATPSGVIQPVEGLNFTIKPGEIFALVGESGCGKSITALSISRLLPDNAYLCEGSEIFLDDEALHLISESKMRKVRANKIGMIFQDPGSALNPVSSAGEQVLEALKQSYPLLSNGDLRREMVGLLEKVRLPHPKRIAELYPHQLSGGLKQRIVIAIALAKRPALLIADEATTALDVTTQAQVLDLIQDLNQQFKMAILFITHDLGIVAKMADTVAVMYAGHIIEKAAKGDFFEDPKHPYSKQLFAALPENARHGEELAVIPGGVPKMNQSFTLCRFKERCRFKFSYCEEIKPLFVPINENHRVRCHWYDQEILKKLPKNLRIESLIKVENRKKSITENGDQASNGSLLPILEVTDLKVSFPITGGIFKRAIGYVHAVDGISFKIREGQTLALVGESGCGKTTVAKAILKLVNAQGKVIFQGEDLFNLHGKKLHAMRADYQMIFQDPYSSMDPHMRISTIISEGMDALRIGTNDQEREERVSTLLEQVGLPASYGDRYPHELSGGQRQRVAIARALAVGAQLIICDEPTSALDVSVQAQILNVLKLLQDDLGISYLFITHNISVVRYLADNVAVMHEGKIVEYGTAREVLRFPTHPYTKALLSSVPAVVKV